MKRLLNKILKYLGFNVVRAKRARKRIVVKPYTPEELRNCPLVHPANLVKTHDPSNDGRTHYVGDGCIPPHPEFETRCVKQPNSDNDVKGPTS